MWALGGFRGYGGPVWVMGEWAMSQWIVDNTSFQKIYGLYRDGKTCGRCGRVRANFFPVLC